MTVIKARITVKPEALKEFKDALLNKMYADEVRELPRMKGGKGISVEAIFNLKEEEEVNAIAMRRALCLKGFEVS